MGPIRPFARPQRGPSPCREDAVRHLAPLLDDPDDGVRATALKAVAATDPDRAAGGCSDPSPAVRGAALDALAGCGQGAPVGQAMRTIVHGGFADTLVQAWRRHPVARRVLLEMLQRADTLSRQGLLMMLEAVTHTVDAGQADAGGGGEPGKAAS